MSQDKLSVLVVEDDEIDQEFLRRKLRSLQDSIDLVFASDGHEALKILRQPGPDSMKERRIVLLDLNMPGISGIEVLQEIRKEPSLSGTIVFMLTSSDAAKDLAAVYQLGISGYMLKSQLGDASDKLIGLIQYYQSLNQFAPRPSP